MSDKIAFWSSSGSSVNDSYDNGYDGNEKRLLSQKKNQHLLAFSSNNGLIAERNWNS